MPTHKISVDELRRLKVKAFRVVELPSGEVLLDLLGSPEELEKYPDVSEHLRSFICHN